MFKRASKLALAPSSSREEGEPSSSFKIALSVPKRVKASLQSANNGVFDLADLPGPS
jgi:hypothetical protein